jgi:hypothetical protein
MTNVSQEELIHKAYELVSKRIPTYMGTVVHISRLLGIEWEVVDNTISKNFPRYSWEELSKEEKSILVEL